MWYSYLIKKILLTEIHMKIVVTYDEGSEEVFQHFGRTPAFKVYDVQDRKVKAAGIIPSGEYSHGELAGFLKNLGVDVLICGGLGMGAKSRIEEAGIKLFGGVTGKADNAVEAYLNGTLDFDPLAAEHHGPCMH